MENQPSAQTNKTNFLTIVKNVVAKIKHGLHIFHKEVISYPLYILSHPIAGWQEFKQEKRGKMSVAITIVLLYVIMKMVEYKYLGPVVNTNNPYKFNSVTILVYGIVPPILLAVSNWSVTTLMDGKGKMNEIFTMIGFFNIILSNFITTDEAQFITILQIIGWALTGIMAFMGLLNIHEYGLGKTIWSIFLTILAAVIIVFVALLVFNLAEQIYGFIYSLYSEISARYM
jgi:hypothetical protein